MHTTRRTSRKRNRITGLLLASAASVPALICAGAAGAQESASEQTVADASVDLPPVIVEGATLEAKPAVKPKKSSGSSGGAYDEAPVKSKSKTKSGGTATASKGSVSGNAPVEPQEPPAAAAEPAPTTESAPASETAGGLPIDKLGTSVSVVTAKDIKEQQITNGADALRSLPGVSVSRSGGPGNVSVVRIRGAESNHTLVLIDGVEVNSGVDGFFDFANLPADDIERIEVLRGPQSGLYGSGALGGVVNVITKSGKGPLRVTATGEAGSYNTQSGSVHVSGGNDNIWGAFTVHGRQTDGFNISETGSEDDGSALSGFTFRGGAQMMENFRIDATLRRTRLEGDRDNGFGDLTGPYAKPADDLSTFSNETMLGRIEGTLDTLDGRWIHKVRFAGVEANIEDFDRGAFGPLETLTDTENLKYGYSSTFRLDMGPSVRHYLTGLVENEREFFEQPSGTDGRKERERTSYAGEIRGEYFDILDLTGTVRTDDNYSFDDYTTWRTAASLKVPGTWFRLHGSTGTAVKYPSFGELYGFFVGFTPNPGLVAEESFGWDGGVETTLLGGKAVIDVTYFDQNLENEIDYRALPGFKTQPFNREGESIRKGIEVSTRVIVVPGVTLGAAYTYLDATEEDGTQEVRRPRHSGRGDLNVAFDGERGNFNLAAIYNGTMDDIVFDSGFPFGSAHLALDSYWLVTAAVSYKVLPGMELFGRVENAFDDNYQEIYGYETAGLAAYAGVRLSYEEGQSLPK